jgi:hypothetical protein
MPTIHTKDDIYLDIPDGMAPDAPEVREAVAAERAGRRQRHMMTPEFKAKVAAQEAQDRETYDPTIGMSGGEKLAANVSAGVHSFWDGAKQLIPGMKGPSDDELRETRARDRHLAEKSDLGIGADWMPTAGSVAQFAGEAVPGMLIPGGAAAKLLPKALSAAKPVLSQMIGGAAGGATSGALTATTSDESKGLNTLVGGALGSVLPLGMKAYRMLRGEFSPSAASRAGTKLVNELGDEPAGKIEQQVANRDIERSTKSAASQNIDESLAEATRSPHAAVVEARSARNASANPSWQEFRAQQNRARHGAVQDATQEALDLDARELARDAAADPLRNKALKQAAKDPWFQQPAAQAAQSVLGSDAAAANKSVRYVANMVLDMMGPNATKPVNPSALYEMRKVLQKNLQGPAIIGDEVSAAVKGADRQTMMLIEGIDDALNQASGGQWSKYLKTYQKRSRPVDASTSAQLVRDTFEREGIPEIGGVPHVTATRLGSAMRASKGPEARKFPLALSTQAQGTLDDVAENIARANDVQATRKLAGTSGGGAQTSSDLAQDAVSKIPGRIGQAAQSVMAGAKESTERELASLMQNPQAAVQAIKRALALRQPLTEAQSQAMQMLSSSAGGALPRAMQTQQPR